MKPADLSNHVDPTVFARRLTAATSTKAVKDLLASLPIVPENDYNFDPRHPEQGWKPGYFHWYPVGGERGNAGRIKLAGQPENPLAERTINAHEAVIELMRQLELKGNPSAAMPTSPRDAVWRYFDLPPLDELPQWPHPIRGQKPKAYARSLARHVRLRLIRESRPVEYTVIVEDEGIGQAPALVHERLLSLGSSDKADKPYLVGVFGQGGSSAFAACEFSWVVSRRHPELLDGQADGIGFTIIKRILPSPPRRDVYWAYLAAEPEGSIPVLPASVGPAIELTHGTRIAHVAYNFGKAEPARTLYQSLNHLLFNPVLPYELYTRPVSSDKGPDPMYGNGYRLSNMANDKKALDKRFSNQSVEAQ
jgi:hypothetical protein